MVITPSNPEVVGIARVCSVTLIFVPDCPKIALPYSSFGSSLLLLIYPAVTDKSYVGVSEPEVLDMRNCDKTQPYILLRAV